MQPTMPSPLLHPALQTDNDLFVIEPMKLNIVQHMKQHNITFATHHDIQYEGWV